MARNRTQLVGIAVEGYGTDAAKAAGTIIWYPGAHRELPTLASGSSYAWAVGLLELPAAVSDELDLISGRVTSSAMTFRLSSVWRRVFLWRQGRALGALLSAVSDVDTTLPISAPGLAGAVVYVGQEAVQLGSYTGTTYTGCTRGLWGSTGAAHAAGALFYQRPPNWAGRRVQLLSRDVEETGELRRWDGVITRPPESRSGTDVVLRCESTLGVLQSSTVRAGAIDLNRARSLRYLQGAGLRGTLTGLSGGPHTATFPASPGGASVYLQIGDEGLAEVVADAAGQVSEVQVNTNLLLGSRVETPEVDDVGQRTLDGPVYEVGLWRGAHPLAIVLALLGQDGPTLGGDWRLDLPWIEPALIEAIITARPWERVDRLLVGWDGQDVDVWQTLDAVLLRPWGYVLGLDVTHRLVPVRLDLLSLAAWAEALANVISPYRDPLPEQGVQAAGTDRITARLGELPWRDALRIDVNAPGVSSRRAQLLGIRQRELDLRTVSQERAQTIIPALASHVLAQLHDLPTITLRVRDNALSGVDLTLGRWVSLANVGGLGVTLILDGEEVALGEVNGRLAVLLTGRKWDAKTSTYTLTGLFANIDNPREYIRERAPSGIIAEHDDSTGVITLAGLGFGYSGGDAESFQFGDDVIIWYRNGTVWSAVPATLTYAGSGYLQTVPAAYGGDAPAGSIVRLAPSSTYTNPTRYGPITDRPYVALADALEEIDRPGGATEDADVYGGGLGVVGPGTSPVSLPAAFDGSEYTHLDALAAAPNEFHDVFLARALDNNLRYLEVMGDPITLSPIVANAGTYGAGSEDGHRTLTSLGESVVWSCPWIIPTGCTRVEVRLHARVGCEANVGGGATIRIIARLGGLASQLRDEVPVSGWQAIVFDLDLASPASEPIETTFELVVGQREAGDVHDTQAYGVTPYAGQYVEAPSAATGNPYADAVGTRPLAGTQDLLFSQDGTANGANVRLDHLRRTDASGDRGMWVRADGRAVPLAELRTIAMPYLQIRAVELRPVHVPLDVGVLRYGARLPVDGRDDVLHRTRLVQRHERTRPLWVGPIGSTPNVEADWPDGYHELLGRVLPNEPGPEEGAKWKTLQVMHGWPRGAAGLLRASVDWLPFHLTITYSSGGDLDELLGAGTVIVWQMRLVLKRYVNGSTTPVTLATGEAVRTRLTHYPFDDGGASTLLKGELIRALKAGGYGYVYREGQRYPEDLGLVQRTTLTIPANPDAASTPQWVEWQVRLVTEDNTAVEWGAGEPGEQELTRVAPWVLGASLWEVATYG